MQSNTYDSFSLTDYTRNCNFLLIFNHFSCMVSEYVPAHGMVWNTSKSFLKHVLHDIASGIE